LLISMTGAGTGRPQRILIISSHALFGEGLRSLLRKRDLDFNVVGLLSTIEEAVSALETLEPDLVIVDYDDEAIDRDAFLTQFVGGRTEMRVVLLSLLDGEQGQEALVYDRRTLASSQMDEWLQGVTGVPEITKQTEERQIQPRSANMKHIIVAGVLVLLFTVGLGLVLTPGNLLPVQASLQSVAIDGLFSFHFWAISFLFSLIIVFMLYSIIVFRRKKGETGEGVYTEGSTSLEVTWTVIPLGVVMGLAFWGSQVLADTNRVADNALQVNVIASQWNWRFEYPEFDIISSELALPVNRQVELSLSSQDVIHSFYVPEFRLKQDALPGGEEMVRQLRVTPSMVGNFKIRCAELCGLQHTEMLADVLVMPESDFNAWVDEALTSVSDDPVIRGQTWSIQYGCVACHSVDGSVVVGPSWLGVYGAEENLADGTTVPIDDAYLYESIRNPGAKIVEGFQNIMPATIAEGMTDEQVADVIEYIKSLK
jgi:cytochrome c oxidase subunit 2